MREYKRYKKEKRIALTIIGVLLTAILAFVLVFSLTAKNGGNSLSSLTPEVSGSLDLNTGNSADIIGSTTVGTPKLYASASSRVTYPSGYVTEVGSVPSGYNADTSYADFAGASGYTGTFSASGNYRLTSDMTIAAADFGKAVTYSGIFDGAGHTITVDFGTSTTYNTAKFQTAAGYSADSSNAVTCSGLFAELNGTVKNLKIVVKGNLTIEHNIAAAFGVLAGWVNSGTVQNVSIELYENSSITMKTTSESRHEKALGLFSGIAGKASTSYSANFYNVESIINGTLQADTSTSTGAHVTVGGVVGVSTRINMNGVAVSGNGNIKMLGASGWRFLSAVIGFSRAQASHTLPIAEALTLDNVLLSFEGLLSMAYTGNENNIGSIISNAAGMTVSTKVYTTCTYADDSAFNHSTTKNNNQDSSNNITSAFDRGVSQFRLFGRVPTGSSITNVNVKSSGSNTVLKLLHEVGTTNVKVIAAPTSSVGFTPLGVSGISGVTYADFNEGGYVELNNATTGRYEPQWSKTIPSTTVGMPDYTLGWLTDFGKVPYGYAVPGNATAIATETELRNWAANTTSKYGYLTANISLTSQNRIAETLASGKILDGAGHTITVIGNNSWSLRTGSTEASLYGKTTCISGGLFNYNEGTIKNLTVQAASGSSFQNTGGANGKSFLNGLVVGINKSLGRIENVGVYIPSGADLRYHIDYQSATTYNILSGVVGVNEGYVGYCGTTNEGKLENNASTEGTSNSARFTALGGVIGVNLGQAEYLTSFGSANDSNGYRVTTAQGAKYIGSVVGVSADANASIFTGSAFTPTSGCTGSLSYAYSGYDGYFNSSAAAYIGAVAGYVAGEAKGIAWFAEGSYGMINNSTSSGSIKASGRQAVGGSTLSSITGGNVRVSNSAVGVIHGYFDYFYNDGSLKLEFENPADIESFSVSGSNYEEYAVLREADFKKSGLDSTNNNLTLNVNLYTAASAPNNPYSGLQNTWFESYVLAGIVDDLNPIRETQASGGSEISSLPLSGSGTYYLNSDKTLYVYSSNYTSSNMEFSGILDGRGHTLTINLNGATLNHKDDTSSLTRDSFAQTDKAGVGIAGVLATKLIGATIKNVNIVFTGDLTFSTDTGYSAFFGLLAGLASNTYGGNITQVLNTSVKFSSGSVRIRKSAGADCYAGGLFGCLGRRTLVKNCLVIGSGGNFNVDSAGSSITIWLGLLSGRVATSNTSAGYENVVLTGSHTTDINQGSQRVSTVFGASLAGWVYNPYDNSASGTSNTGSAPNCVYYKRNNIFFYNSSFYIKGDRAALFAEANVGSVTGNSSTYISGIKFINDSSGFYQSGTLQTGVRKARILRWSGGDMSGTSASTVVNCNEYSSLSGFSPSSPMVTNNLTGVNAWRDGIATYRANLAAYNTALGNVGNVTASVKADGKTVSSGAALGMYFVKGTRLYGSTGSYQYRGFVRYATRSNNYARYYLTTPSNPALSGSSTNLGSIELKNQLTFAAYAAHKYGTNVSEPEGYLSLYAKFDKILNAYVNASGDETAFYKSMLERSANPVSGVGITGIALPAGITFTVAESDKTLSTDIHWLTGRLSGNNASDTYYIYQNPTKGFRLEITPSLVDISGLFTGYNPGSDTDGAVDTIKSTLDRTVSANGSNSAGGYAVLYGRDIDNGEYVYFGQTSGGYGLDIFYAANSELYDTADSAKTALEANSARNGYFVIKGVTNSGETTDYNFVSLPNSGYSIIVGYKNGNTGNNRAAYDAGANTVTVGNGTNNDTVALYRYQATAIEMRIAGEIADSRVESGWRSFRQDVYSDSTIPQGQYLPGNSDGIFRNARFGFVTGSSGNFVFWENAAKTEVSVSANVGVNTVVHLTPNAFATADTDADKRFGNYIYYDWSTTAYGPTVSIAPITIAENNVSVVPTFNAGTVDSKFYDGYNDISGITNVKGITEATVSVSGVNIHSNWQEALENELLGTDTKNYAVSYKLMKDGTDATSLDVGVYNYCAEFSLNANANYNIASALIGGKVFETSETFTVKPLPLAFDYTVKRETTALYTGSRIDFVDAQIKSSSVDAAVALIKTQYASDSEKTAAETALRDEIAEISANRIGVRYVFAADPVGVVTMFNGTNESYRYGATYASKTTVQNGTTVVAESGAINAGTYYYSGYVVGTQNFVGLTDDYRKVVTAASGDSAFSNSYIENHSFGLRVFSNRGWGISLDDNCGYADAYNFAAGSLNSGDNTNLTNTILHYYGLLNDSAYASFIDTSDVAGRTVNITRSTVSVYVKDSAIVYGEVDPLSSAPSLGPVVPADYVITDTAISADITVRIKPEAFNIDGTTYEYLPVKLADPNNPDSALTSYRNALYINVDEVGETNPNLIMSAVDGNLTVVRKELTVTWSYDTSSAYYQQTGGRGAYTYAKGVKHTMIPSYHGILNVNALDFDIVGDGDMESVGVHKIVAAFSSRYALDSYNYYLGNSATGYMTVAPQPVTAEMRYYSDSNRTNEYGSSDILRSYVSSSGTFATYYAALTFTVGGKTYRCRDNSWVNVANSNETLDLTVYPADKWLKNIKDNALLGFSPSGSVSINWWSTASSFVNVMLYAPSYGSSYVYGAEMDGFVLDNFSVDMHSVRNIQIYNNSTNSSGTTTGSIDTTNITTVGQGNIKQKTTGLNVNLSASPSDVFSYNDLFYDGGQVVNATNIQNRGAHYELSASDYANLGYAFDAGEAFGTNYYGLFNKSGSTANLKDNASYDQSRYAGFDSIIYSMSAAGNNWHRTCWDSAYTDQSLDGNMVLVYFNVNITNAATAAIAKNGGINVSVGGVAITAGDETHTPSGLSTAHSYYQAGPMTAGIAVNEFGNSGMQNLKRADTWHVFGEQTGVSGNVSGVGRTYPSLSSYIYGRGGVSSSYRENLLYDGESKSSTNVNENFFFDTSLQSNGYPHRQAFIYASNAEVARGTLNNIIYYGNTNSGSYYQNSSASTSQVTLKRRTLVSSAVSNGTSVLQGDSFRVNLYALGQTGGAGEPNNAYRYSWGRGVMAQFGNIQVVLSKSDRTAPTVSAPQKVTNGGYEFTVTDSVGVDISSIEVTLKNGKILTVANGGLNAVSRTMTNGLPTAVKFRTVATAGGMTVAAGTDGINQISKIKASDYYYAGSQNTAYYGFSKSGGDVYWGQGNESTTFSGQETELGFVDTVAPPINFTHVGLDNYDVTGGSWTEFTANNYEQQIAARKYITATWRQQNYLWLKFSSGTGKIPSAEVTAEEYNFSNGNTIASIAAKYPNYVGTIVTPNGYVWKMLHLTCGSNNKYMFFYPDGSGYFTRNNGQTLVLHGETITVADGTNGRVYCGSSEMTFPMAGLTRVAVYDRGDYTGTPVYEPTLSSDGVFTSSAIRLEANTRYYFVAEDSLGNRYERTLFFNMVDTASASSLSIIADPVELDDNKLKPYTGTDYVVNGGSVVNWVPSVAEHAFGVATNPRFAFDIDNDGMYDYRVMLMNFDNDATTRVAVRSTVDGKITYICGTRNLVDTTVFEANASSQYAIARWLAEMNMKSLKFEGYTKAILTDANNNKFESSLMVINDEDYNDYIEDTWSNTSVIMRLVGSGESNSLARFYYRYAPDPSNPNLPNTAIDVDFANVSGRPNLYRNYGWIALPVTVDANGNVVVDNLQSLIFEHTGIYRLEIKIELAAGQNSYLVYRDSFGNWVYNAYAEGETVRAYKVDSGHYTTYNGSVAGGAEFNGTETDLGYYTVKIDKRMYFLDMRTYWHAEEEKSLGEQVEDVNPDVAGNAEFANIDLYKWNTTDNDYTNELHPQESGEFNGAYKIGSSSASNRNSWVRLDVKSHIKNINGDDMWYAVYKILADVYVGDRLVQSGVNLPLGSETNRYEVGKPDSNPDDGINDSIAMRRIRDMAISMPDVDITSTDSIRLVYRFYFKYYYSFVVDYGASYASYYGTEPTTEIDIGNNITPISGNLKNGYSIEGIKVMPVELIGSDGSEVNFNFASVGIHEYINGQYYTGGFTVTRIDDRGISRTENIQNTITVTKDGIDYLVPVMLREYADALPEAAAALISDGKIAEIAKSVYIDGTQCYFFVGIYNGIYYLYYATGADGSYQCGRTAFSDNALTIPATALSGAKVGLAVNLKRVSSTTSAGKHFYALMGGTVTNGTTTSGDYILKYQRAAVYSGSEGAATKSVVASMTSSQIQMTTAAGAKKYSFYGFALGETDNTFDYNDDYKVNYIVVNGERYEVEIVNDSATETFAKLYKDGVAVGTVSTKNVNTLTLTVDGVAASYDIHNLAIYNGDGYEVGEFGNEFTVGGSVYSRSGNNPYYTVEKAFVNVSKGGNFAKRYDGTNDFLGADSKISVSGWNTNTYSYFNGTQWSTEKTLGEEAPKNGLTTVEVGGYYVGADGLPQANVSIATDITYLKLFLPSDGNYRFAIAETKHTVVGGKLVKDGAAIGTNQIPSGFKQASAGEIIGVDAPVSSGVQVSSPVNWSSVMLPDTSYENGNRIIGGANALSSISTIAARPVAAKSEVKNNDVVEVTFNGAAQGGAAIKIIEDVTQINDKTGYGTLPGETVVFSIIDGSTSAASSPILAGSYSFDSVNPDSSKVGIASVERAFGAVNPDSIPQNYYVDNVQGSGAVNFTLNINRLDNSFALNRVVKSDGSGYELRITIANLKKSKEGLDFLNVALDDAGNRYLTDGEFSRIKDMIVAGGDFSGNDSLNGVQNKAYSDEYYELLKRGTELKLGTEASSLNDDEARLIELHRLLEQVLEYRFQSALGKIFKSANNGSETFYTNMPDFREGRFSDWKFDERTGYFTMVYKGNVNLDSVFFSDRYSMRVSGFDEIVSPNATSAVYSTNSWTSASSLADGQLERYDYIGNDGSGTVKIDDTTTVSADRVTFISTADELKSWLQMTDSSANGYDYGVLTTNIFAFSWGYANGLGGAPVGLAEGRTLNGNGYVIGISGAEFNNAGYLNMRFAAKTPTNYQKGAGNSTTRWYAGGAFLQYVDGTIQNANFVYRATRKYDVSITDTTANSSGRNGMSTGIIAGYAGVNAAFKNVSLDVKGQFFVDYVGVRNVSSAPNNLQTADYVTNGGFVGYADNIASFADCSVNYYYVPNKSLDNGFGSGMDYAISTTIETTENVGLHLAWGGFAGITGGSGTARRLAVRTLVEAEHSEDTDIPSVFIGRKTGSGDSWMRAGGMFGFTARTYSGTSSTTPLLGQVDGIINDFGGRIVAYNAAEIGAGSIVGDKDSGAFVNVYSYGASVSGGYVTISGSGAKTVNALPQCGRGGDSNFGVIHSEKLSIYENDKGYIDYYFGGNRYDYYDENGVKYFYQTTKFINDSASDGSSVVYSPFDDYVKVNGTETKGWTGWKLSPTNANGSHKVYLDYDRTVEIGSIDLTNSRFTLQTVENGVATENTYTFDADGNVADADFKVSLEMMTISDQNNTYYFSVPKSKTDTDTPRRDTDNGINIEILAPSQSFIWEYQTTFYANNLGKTAAVSRVVWNLAQIGTHFDAQYETNDEGFVVSEKNDAGSYTPISGVNWHTPALGTFTTVSADSRGTVFQFVYDGKNHNNNISVTVIVNGSSQTITADANVDMIDAGVYVVGTFNLGADTVYDGGSEYTFDIANRKGQFQNVQSPQLMVVIYPRVLKLEGGVAKQYDGTTVYEHVIADADDSLVNDAETSDGVQNKYDGILTDDKDGRVTVLGTFGEKAETPHDAHAAASACDDKTISFGEQVLREVYKKADGTLLSIRREQDRTPKLNGDGKIEFTTVSYGGSVGAVERLLDVDDTVPFGVVAETIAAFYGAVGQVDSVEEVRATFAEVLGEAATDAEITAAITEALAAADAAADTATIYNFKTRVGGINASETAGTEADEYFYNKTEGTLLNKEEYGALADTTGYEFLKDYVYIAAALDGERGFNYALSADGVRIPLTGGTIGAPTYNASAYDKDALGNGYVKITAREIDVLFNGLYQSFYNDDADAGYDYKSKLHGFIVANLTGEDGTALPDDATDAEKAAAVRRLFTDLPTTLTDAQVLSFYDSLAALAITLDTTAVDDEVAAAFAGQEVKQFGIAATVVVSETDPTPEADFTIKTEDLTNGRNVSQVLNVRTADKTVTLTVGHYNGKENVDGTPYVGGEHNSEQYLSLLDRRGVLNLGYGGTQDNGYFTYAGYNFYLESDVDMEGATMRGVNWSLPAGTSSNAGYAVTFDGGNFAITNFTLAQNATDGQANGITHGFFNAIAEGATVKNLIIADADVLIYGQSHYKDESGVSTSREMAVGGIAGTNYGTIENCAVEGSVHVYDNGTAGTEIIDAVIGGATGVNYGSVNGVLSIVNLETNGSGAHVVLGGLVGRNCGSIDKDGTVSYAAGKTAILHGASCTVGSVVGETVFTDEDGNAVTPSEAWQTGASVLDMSIATGDYNATNAALEYAGRTVENIVRAYSLTDKQYGRPDDETNTAPYGSAANPVKIHNFRQLEMALQLGFYHYEISEDVIFNTGYSEELFLDAFGSGYGYGRIKIADGKSVVIKVANGVMTAIRATASGITVENFGGGTTDTPYGVTVENMVKSFFTAA